MCDFRSANICSFACPFKIKVASSEKNIFLNVHFDCQSQEDVRYTALGDQNNPLILFVTTQLYGDDIYYLVETA